MRILLAGVTSVGNAVGAFLLRLRAKRYKCAKRCNRSMMLSMHLVGRAAEYTAQDWNHMDPGGG